MLFTPSTRMIALQNPVRRRNRKHTTVITRLFRPKLEPLEDRLLLSSMAWPEWLAPQPALAAALATLDSAQALGFVANPDSQAPFQAASATGSIVDQGGAGTVDWYSFTLDEASDVRLATFDATGGNHLNGVLSLYNTNPLDPFYPLSFTAPPFDPQQHRLLAQEDAATAPLERKLAAGTYFVAVSGQGNRYFNPFLAESGYAGDTGDYRLLVTTTPLPLGPNDGPAVLSVDFASDPTGAPVLHGSPLAIYVGFSSPIDPSTVSLWQPWSLPGDPPPTVQLTYNPTGEFGSENDRPIVFTGFYYSPVAKELQLQPAAPLGPGFYRLTLAGNPGDLFNPVLTDATNTFNIGQNHDHASGQDFATTFQIDGSEGTVGSEALADDTPASAHQLPPLTQNQLVQVAGTIGDDPAYDPSLPPPDPSAGAPLYLFNPASDVDLYHIQISGTGSYSFAVEVFAGRLGSTLDAAVSLFRLDASNPASPLQLIASNDNSSNTALTSDGRSRPLFTDPVLDVGLGAGDYYLAISASGNMPDMSGTDPGANGVFDPNVSHSGSNGNSTGAYVLNILLQPAVPAPRVSATSISAGAVLTSPPSRLTVTFDSHVNVATLANQAFNATSESTVSGVFLVGPDDQRYFPRLESYSVATHQAEFLLLDRLPNGINELHLSGAHGLTAFGGVRLAGNDASGDYVLAFAVDDPTAPSDPLNRSGDASATPSDVQDLGILFPHELQTGVTVTGTLAAPKADGTPDCDRYTIELLQPQKYHFTLTGSPDAPDALQLTITDAAGAVVNALSQDTPNALFGNLLPGSYTVRICGSSSDGPAPGPYQLLITLLNVPENPPPLSIGATPVLQIRSTNNPAPLPPTGPMQGPTVGRNLEPAPQPIVTVSISPPSVGAASGQGPSLVVRAELLGGVTSTESNIAVAAAAPLQVQGLTTVPSVAAGNAVLTGAALLTILSLASAGPIEPAPESGLATSDAIGAFTRGALDLGTRWLESIPQWEVPSVPGPPMALENQLPLREVELAPLVIALSESTVNSGANAQTQEFPDWSGEAVATVSSEEPAVPVRNETTRNSLAWLGAMFGAALAAFSVWKSLHAPGSPAALKERRKKVRKPPSDVDNDATTVIPQ
jgi:hypothetical protein